MNKQDTYTRLDNDVPEMLKNSRRPEVDENRVFNSLSRIKAICHTQSRVYRLRQKESQFRRSRRIVIIVKQFINNLKRKETTMSNFVQVIGKLVSFDRGNYIFQVGNANIEIPDYKMFHFVTFPDHLMENGHLKTGSEIRLVKKDNQTYYPDRRHYEWMKRSTLSNSADGSYLLEDPAVKPYPVACDDFRTFTRDIATMMGNMNSADREMVLSLLMDSSKNEEEKKQEISKKGILPVNFVESESLEKKSSLFFPAGKGRTDASDKLKKEKNVQMIEIVETIASFANSKSPRPCQLIIGVDDKDRTTGLQNEIASRYPSMRTLDQFQSTYLVTMIKQLTYENASLLQSLAYNWYRLGKDLILVIDINYTGKPVLVKGGRLPYRSGSSKNVIEGTQLVDHILDYKVLNN